MQSFLRGSCLQRFQAMLRPRLPVSRLGADWLLAWWFTAAARVRQFLKWKKSTVLRMFQFHLGDFCHTPLRSFPPCVPRGVLCSLTQKCGPTDGCCNNAHLLLPSPTWTSNHSAVLPPLPSLRSHFAVLQLCVG